MADEQKQPTELKIDRSNLYKEESFTDLKVGIIKRMTPVRSDGSVDKTRKAFFVAQTSLMTPGGPFPIQAVIQAKELQQAIKKFPEAMKDAIEDTGRHVVHGLERYLDTLGTIAAISPLLGLLGTVIGMVKVFTAITTHGVGNPTVLAGGIAEALITTAAGLTVAIPALIGYRYYRNRVDSLVVDMEKEAIKLVEALHRRQDKQQVRFPLEERKGENEGKQHGDDAQVEAESGELAEATPATDVAHEKPLAKKKSGKKK